MTPEKKRTDDIDYCEHGYASDTRSHCAPCARNEALEEAAKIADDEECVVTDEVNCHGSSRIAKAIRALKKQ